ncbi:MAG: ketopantoate reductase family protein [Ruminiclostridium sp.]|nr:ketopantoate reductase family protein [Ruminiclostridium sp.]
MKILVYGCGVIGSYLTHVLCSAGNDVTVCARGRTRKILEKYGLRIKHKLQKKKTIDRPRVIGKADENEHYDIVFSIMQGQQQTALLPALAEVDSPLFVLVGNNLCAADTESEFHRLAGDNKTLLFGFQGTGGVREGNHTICVRWGSSRLVVGGLHSEPSEHDKAVIRSAFGKMKYRPVFMDDMEGWLYCHAAFILPIVYLSYKRGCDLRTAGSREVNDITLAAKEAYGLIRRAGKKICPAGDDAFFDSRMKMTVTNLALRAMAKTFVGELAATDHCRNAVTEMEYIDREFNRLRDIAPEYRMPVWDRMRAALPDWEEIHRIYDR